MKDRLRLLVIGKGAFSGTRRSLVESLRRHGCEVLEVEHSLRYLRLRPVYGLLMHAVAIVLYGRQFRGYVHKTRLANWVHERANDVIVARHSNVDAVLSIQANYGNWDRQKLPGVFYGIFTDHVNMLSKRLPNFGVPPPEKTVHPSWNRVERYILAKQDGIFLMSSNVRDSIVADYGIQADRVKVVGGGPNLDVDAGRDRVRKNYRGHNILFVGKDVERKGLKYLVNAFVGIRSRFPQARLHVVGTGGESRDGIIYHGILNGEPLKRLFYESQVFVLPTLREPFGIVFLEAMWAKCACVGSHVGAIPEIIRDGQTGFVVPPANEQAIEDCVIRLFENPERLEKVAEAAYWDVRSRYSWDRVADRIVGAISAHGREQHGCASDDPVIA